MKRKILVAALLALLLTLVSTSALAACGLTIGATGPDTYIYCDVEGTHESFYKQESDTQCRKYLVHKNSELGKTSNLPGGPLQNHSFTANGEEVVTEATCQTPATVRQYCAYGCGASQVVSSGSTVACTSGANDQIVGKAATCQEDGYYVKICKWCKEEKGPGATIEASTQYCQSGGTRVAYEATCSEKGAYESYCRWCDRSLSFAGDIPVVDHSYTVGPQKVSEATCKHGLEYTYKCKWCSLTTVKTLSNPVNHEAAATYTVTKAATCTSTGEGTYYCKYGCGTVVKTETIPATGEHKYVEEEVKCGSTYDRGYTHKVCSVCKNEDTATGKYAVHTGIRYEDYKYIATCVSGGNGYSYCSTCNVCLAFNVATPINPNNHDRTNTIKDYVVEPTCCEQGAYNKLCGYGCGTTVAWNFKEPATGNHENTKQGDVIKKATCTEDGTAQLICTVYNRVVDTITIPKDPDNHSYTESVSVDCNGMNNRGYEAMACEWCGNVNADSKVYHTGEVKDIKIEATCCSNGAYNLDCAVCGGRLSTKLGIAPTGKNHTYKWIVSKEATCTTAGEEYAICTVRGNALNETRPVPALGHAVDTNYSSKTDYCTKVSEEVHECTREGCDHTEIWYGVYYPGHVIQSKETKAATCLDKGVKTYYCANVEKGYVCDYESNTEDIPALGHQSKALDDHIAATCTKQGRTEGFVCIRPGCAYYNLLIKGHDVIPETGHDMGPYYTEDSTCTKQGQIFEICNNGCGYTEAVGYADLKDHNYVSEVTKYPTCDSTGEVVYTCSACDAEYKEIIPVREHVSHGCDNYYPANCTKPGQKEEFRCIYCFELLMGGEEIPALGHDWGDWDVVKEATETEEGEKVRGCNRPYCDGTESETIPATGNGDDDDKPTPTPTPTPTPSADPNHTPTPTPSADPDDEPDPTSYPDDGPIGPFPTKNPYPIPTPEIDPDHEHEEQELKGFPPTCTEYGREDGTSCGICGETVTGGEWIAPTGHTPVVIPAVAPTETETGLTEGLKCGVCGEILRKQFIVDATGKYYDPENPDVPLDKPFAPGDIVDPSGEDVIGKVDPIGNVTDPSGKYVGTVDEEGNIIDENGNVIGKVDENGKVTDKDGNHVGDVFGYDELEGRLEPGHPNFNLSDYLDEYYRHVEGGDQIRPTIDEDKCIIGTKVKLDKDGITVLIKGAEDYAICPVDNYPMSQWIDLGNGMHKRICTCMDCDYYEIAACVYFIINVDDVEYKICPICGHFTERAYEWIKGVKVGGVGDMNELIARDITSPFGTDAVQVKDMSAEPTVITSSFTAVKSAKGVLSSWNDTETLYIPMVHPGDVTLVEMDFFGEFTALPFEYENGYVIFNADEHGLYLFVD